MRIVIGYRDPTYLEQLQDKLESMGHLVEVADNGIDCLERMREMLPDVLALGSHLCWGSSDGVLSVMQEETYLQDIPVLIMLESDTSLEICRHPMIISSVRQPFQIDDIARQLEFLDLICEGSY